MPIGYLRSASWSRRQQIDLQAQGRNDPPRRRDDRAWRQSSGTSSSVGAAGTRLHLMRAGRGRPVLVLHHDIGTLDRLPFYDALAASVRRAGAAPSGLRPVGAAATGCAACATSPSLYRGCWPISASSDAALVGLGFGGWIAAEMATMAPRDLRRLVLVGAMGIKPPEGEILDQAHRQLHRLRPRRLPRPGGVRRASTAPSPRPTSSRRGTSAAR